MRGVLRENRLLNAVVGANRKSVRFAAKLGLRLRRIERPITRGVPPLVSPPAPPSAGQGKRDYS